MKNKKIILIGILVTLLIAIIAITLVVINFDKNKPEDTLNLYISYINEKKYDEMYELLSKDSKGKINKDDFVIKNKNIYEGIDSANIKIDITSTKKENNITKLIYNQNMETSAGKIESSNSVILEKENDEYKINWSTTLIHPELKEGYKVRVKVLKGRRGSIIDRYGNELAYDGVVSSVGIVPGKLGENKEENITKISELIGVSVENINKFISASYVKDDTFVPVKKISKNNTELKEFRLSVNIDIHDFNTRVKQVIKYLEKGHRIKATIRFRGREMAHTELGKDVLLRFADAVKDYGTPEKDPTMEMRNMYMFISPIKKEGK